MPSSGVQARLNGPHGWEPTPSSSHPGRLTAGQRAPRRRPGVLVSGIAIAAVGGLAAFWAVGLVQDRTGVLVVARSIEAGATVSSGDLTVADVAVPAGVSAVPASERGALVGKVARAPLSAGSVLAPGAIGDPVPPAARQSLVVLALPATRMPASGLHPGQHLLLGSTAETAAASGSDAAAPAATTTGASVSTADAVVVRVGELDPGGTTPVDVSVHDIDGPLWAGLAAANRVAVLVAPQGRGQQ